MYIRIAYPNNAIKQNYGFYQTFNLCRSRIHRGDLQQYFHVLLNFQL